MGTTHWNYKHGLATAKNYTCHACQKIFISDKGYATRTPKYCSRKCAGKRLFIERPQIICGQCKKKFQPSCLQIKNRFCSNKCSAIAKGEKRRGIRLKEIKYISCLFCKKLFESKKACKTRQPKYCSKICYGKSLIKDIHVKEYINYGKNWQKQRKLARQRDNYSCQKCNKKENGRQYDVHHKIPFKKFGLKKHLLANDLNNLITLCHYCHLSIEPRKKQKNVLTVCKNHSLKLKYNK